ncbi:MAG: hypothetical protein GF320_09035 [Armatimonadia bacterium]|nr:hypothetical protein [Armatimonadia bacterium]
MSEAKTDIYIGSILLERNRWKPGKIPSYRVSEWIPRFQAAGFDGIELWEHHATLAPADELAALVASPLPIAIFNEYSSFDQPVDENRCLSALMTHHLGAGGVKYNLGNEPALRDTYMAALRDWAARLPEGCRILCECHPGNVMDDPRFVADFLGELGGPGFQAMCHPFSVPLKELEEWLDVTGDRTTHAHVQLRDAQNAMHHLEYDTAYARDVLALLRSKGFSGTFTVEFTETTGAAEEDMSVLWEYAVRDLAFLRENWQ